MQGSPPPGYPPPGYPPGYPPPGYPPGYPPPGQPGGYGSRPPRPGMSVLTIVLIVLVVVLILGGGGCLVCLGVAATMDDAADAAPAIPTPPALVRDEIAQSLEGMLQKQGIPATLVTCPPVRDKTFTCDLTVGEDHAPLDVRDTGSGYAFDVPNTAFLDGAKLTASFRTVIAAKVDPNLRVPCFTGTLMKQVSSSFSCEVFAGTASTGTLSVVVLDVKGNVKMDYEGSAKPGATAPSAPVRGPRVIDFACPGGTGPGTAVRAGCLCGDEIIGTACGAAGNFTDVVATRNGCRFTCGN